MVTNSTTSGPDGATDHFSREHAAGYDPSTLTNAKLLIIGAGALSQNLLLDLALVQIGEMFVIDFDVFEGHNRTRSPLFPTNAERERYGNQKAAAVTRKLRNLLGRATEPVLRYSVQPIQALGDQPFRAADVIISCVDNAAGRAWISNMARKYGRPLVEGGFDADDISFGVFGNKLGDPCWQCSWAEPVEHATRFSCDAYARQIEQRGFVPATQPAAAMLAAMMAEATIQLLQKSCPILNRRVYANVRCGNGTSVSLTLNDDCLGRHHPLPEELVQLSTTSNTVAHGLLEEIATHVDDPIVILPAQFIEFIACQTCRSIVTVNRPIWRLSQQPRCTKCHGDWPRFASPPAIPFAVHDVLTKDNNVLLDFPCRLLGIAEGSVLEVTSPSDKTMFFEVSANGAAPSFSLLP